MLFKCVKLDNLLNNFRSELGNWSENMPKVWLSYIRMHLFKHLDKYIKIYQYGNNMASMDNMLWNILSGTKFMIDLNNNTVVNYEFITQSSPAFYFYYLVERPVGHFMFQPRDQNFDTSVKVEWKLNPILHLNLTFFEIKFSFCISNCELQELHLELFVVTGNSSCEVGFTKEPAYRFCGQYSMFNLFSNNNHIKLCHFYYQDINSQYEVVGMFMTIDKNQLFNEPTLGTGIYEPILEKGMKPQFVYNIKKKYELFRFFIVVNILNKVILAMNDSKIHRYVVFDGPGLICDTIHKRKTQKYIITSTFQCLILLLELNNNDVFFTFASKKIPINNQVVIGQNTKSIFYYPNQECNENFCILSFHAAKGFHINITTILVKSEISTHNMNCLYAGLYAGEEVVSQFIENRIVTGNNDSQAISFYSNNSSMILFVYWYRKISKIDASVVVSLTKCKPIVLNPCYSSGIYSLQCDYLPDLMSFSDIDLTIVNAIEITYALKGIDCIIILISNVQSVHGLVQHCVLVLTPSHAVDIQLRYTIYNSDFEIVEHKLEHSEEHLTFFRNFSEPTVPRLMNKKKKVVALKNEILKSGVHHSKDASLYITIGNFLIKSRIELLIQTSVANLINHLSLRRFAMDFPCCTNLISPLPLPIQKPANRVILLKSKTKISDLNELINAKFITMAKWPWILNACLEYYEITLDFLFPFYQLKYGKYFSFPSNSKHKIQTYLYFIDTSRNEPLTYVWIKDNYFKHKSFLELKSEKCFIKAESLLCKKIVVNKSVYYREYYLITQIWKEDSNSIIYYKPKSWNDATNACQLVGGHLPWFESRESLHEILSLFKLSKHFPTTDVIYIGLKYNTTEVSQKFSYFLFISYIIVTQKYVS